MPLQRMDSSRTRHECKPAVYKARYHETCFCFPFCSGTINQPAVAVKASDMRDIHPIWLDPAPMNIRPIVIHVTTQS